MAEVSNRWSDELEPFIAEQMTDPAFKGAYERACRIEALVASMRAEADGIGMNEPRVADLLNRAATALEELG